MTNGTDVKIDYADIDREGRKTAMVHDVAILENLLNELAKVTPEHDLKLQTLKGIIDEKMANPINPGNKKVLVFSAFADTANYLYEHISKWVKEKHGVETALIQGGGNKATIKNCMKHTNHLLTMFSPISKNRAIAFAYFKRWHDMVDAKTYNIGNGGAEYAANTRESYKDIDMLSTTCSVTSSVLLLSAKISSNCFSQY